MKSKTFKQKVIFIKIIFLVSLSLLNWTPTYADETATFTTSVAPNVLIILDNSNSMDQDFYGNAVSSWRTQSRSVQARKAIIDLIVNPYYDQLRLGLMTYRVGSASKYHLHYSNYFTSFNPASYCPLGDSDDDKACLQACENYCKTGTGVTTCDSCCKARNPSFDAVTALTLDEMFSSPTNQYYPVGSEQRNRYCRLVFPRTQRIQNPTDPSNYIYHKTPGTFYSPNNQGNAFCYAQTYSAQEGSPPNYTSDSYTCRTTKTGTSDAFVGYGSTSAYNGPFQPTDEDLALGFLGEFGRRNYWIYSGRTWFKNSSPGGGYLHIPCQNGTTTHRDNLLAKLNPFENDENGYMSCTSTSNVENCSYIVNAGLTPTAGTLQTAIDYFKGSSSPIQYWCQNNFIIYVTDGLPSVAENGTKGTAASLMPAVIDKIRALRNLQRGSGQNQRTYDIKTYIIGVGMTDTAKAYLDQMALEGGTAVDGKAFYADNPEQLRDALSRIVQDIIEKTFSFTTASVKSTRVQDENHLFEASFEPKNNTAFWPGNLKRFTLNPDGTVPENHDWNAGERLEARNPSTRTIYTYFGGSLKTFDTSNITKELLGVSNDTERNRVVGFIRGESQYQPLSIKGKKLGDIFHSNPVTVGTPNEHYTDPHDNSGYKAFRSSNIRTADNKIILAGSNDGQLHAFGSATGEEKWSFIPPNMLPKLKQITQGQLHHYLVDGPITASDVWKQEDGWKTVAVFGLGKGVNEQSNCVNSCASCPSGQGYYCYKYNVCSMNSSTCKDQQDRCVRPTYLWSSSPDCSTGFSHQFGGSFKYYCGYHALDITNTNSPSYMWKNREMVRDDIGPYLGEPWSKMAIGRVKHNGVIKDVGFIGGGYCPPSNANCGNRGKGLFVIDIFDNGKIIKAFTGFTDYAMPAGPATIHISNNGLTDIVYAADLQGNIWRFTCAPGKSLPCDINDWQVSKFFDATGQSQGARPVYGLITAARDNIGNLWVYWVTGDRSDPLATSTNERVYGVKERESLIDKIKKNVSFVESDLGSFTVSNLRNVTSSQQSCTLNDRGWFMNFTGSEKAFSDVTVFGGVVYFTTYLPPTSCSDPCSSAGESRFYAINYETCKGVLSGEQRYLELGGGMASSPVISFKPGMPTPGQALADIFVTIGGTTLRVPINPQTVSIRSNLLFWRDRRVQ